MARTFRRVGTSIPKHVDHECVRFAPSYWGWVPLDPSSSAYRKAVAEYHSDSTSIFKEPGPSWFRNLYAERPMRQRNKRELKKFLLDNSYEPMVFSKYPLQYWT